MTDETREHKNDLPDGGESSSSGDELERRRRAVRNILAGAGVVTGSQALSSTWTRPVIESVVLPAHAQTTDIVLGGAIGGGIGAADGSDAGILEHLIRPAHAAPLIGGCIRLTVVGNTVTVLLVLTNNQFGEESTSISGENFSVGIVIDSVTYTINGQFNQVPGPTQASGTASGGGENGSYTVTVGAAGSCVKPSSPGTTAGTTTTTTTTTTTFNPCTTPQPYYYTGGCYATPPPS